MAKCISACVEPAASISTNVPSNGRARRTLSEAVGNGHDPLHAFGHVVTGQGGPGDIADIDANLQRAAIRLSDELCKPAGAPDFSAIRLAIFKDIDLANSSGRIQCDRIVDVEVFADYAVKNKKTKHAAARLG